MSKTCRTPPGTLESSRIEKSKEANDLSGIASKYVSRRSSGISNSTNFNAVLEVNSMSRGAKKLKTSPVLLNMILTYINFKIILLVRELIQHLDRIDLRVTSIADLQKIIDKVKNNVIKVLVHGFATGFSDGDGNIESISELQSSPKLTAVTYNKKDESSDGNVYHNDVKSISVRKKTIDGESLLKKYVRILKTKNDYYEKVYIVCAFLYFALCFIAFVFTLLLGQSKPSKQAKTCWRDFNAIDVTKTLAKPKNFTHTMMSCKPLIASAYAPDNPVDTIDLTKRCPVVQFDSSSFRTYMDELQTEINKAWMNGIIKYEEQFMLLNDIWNENLKSKLPPTNEWVGLVQNGVINLMQGRIGELNTTFEQEHLMKNMLVHYQKLNKQTKFVRKNGNSNSTSYVSAMKGLSLQKNKCYPEIGNKKINPFLIDKDKDMFLYNEKLDSIDRELLSFYYNEWYGIINTFLYDHSTLWYDRAIKQFGKSCDYVGELERLLSQKGYIFDKSSSIHDRAEYAFRKYVEHVSNIIKGAPPVPTGFFVYRGLKKPVAKLEEQSIVENQGFTSTSLDFNVADRFSWGTTLRIFIPAGSHVLYYHSYEQEVLLPPNAAFLVTKIERNVTKRVITTDLVYIPDKSFRTISTIGQFV